MEIQSRNFGTERFLLALIVLIWHCNGYQIGQIKVPIGFNYGELTVLIFFALSGYIISKSICSYYLNNPIGFLKNRLISLVPPIYFFSLLSSFIQCNDLLNSSIASPMQCSNSNLFANFYAIMPFKFFLDKIFQITLIELLPLLWAIRVEFLFYFITAGVVYVSYKKNISDKSKIYLVLSLLLTCFLGYFFIGNLKISSYLGYVIYFLLGFLFFLREKNKKIFNLIIYITLICVFFHAFSSASINERQVSNVSLEKLDSISLMRGFYVTTLIVLIFSLRKKLFFTDKISNYLGKISFFIYISHYVVIFLCQKYLPIDNNYLYLYVLPLTTLTSSITCNLYEKLIFKVKYKIRFKKTYQ
jgi:peptidoglycan/LPS O-acetylase OafA/YrhL